MGRVSHAGPTPRLATYTVRARTPGDWFPALTAVAAAEALYECWSGRSLASAPLTTETLADGDMAEARIDSSGAGLVVRTRDEGGNPMNGWTLRLEVVTVGLVDRSFRFSAAVYCEVESLPVRRGHLTHAWLVIDGDPSTRETLAFEVREAFAALTLEAR